MGIGLKELLVILVIVVLLFGTAKFRNIGKDLGGAIKGFKEGMRSGTDDKPADASAQVGQTVDGEVKRDKV